MMKAAVAGTAAVMVTATGVALWTEGENPAGAHSGATGVVKKRMDHMKRLAEILKSIKAGVRARPEIDRGAIADGAREIADRAERTLSLFPEGSAAAPSKARPVIWKNWQAFRRANEKLKAEASKLATLAAQDGDRRAVTVQFARTARACGGCHERFRRERE